MPRTSNKRWLHDRRVRFHYAIKVQGYIGVNHWCSEQDITLTHLNYVLRGQRASARLDDLIAEAIAFAFGKEIGKMFAVVAP